VHRGLGGTGVVGTLRAGSSTRRIGLRADMDALPIAETSGKPWASRVFGKMHACGHDGHTAMLLSAARHLAATREFDGIVHAVFQPAEEGPPDGETGGADQMLDEGIFKSFKPEAVFGLHVWSTLNAGQLGYRSGPLMAASDRFNIVVKGRQTHGSRPWGGVDPIVAAAEIVSSAQSIVSRRQNLTKQPVVLSFGAIKGGIRYNIIPDSVELIGTIRTFDDEMRAQVFKDLANVAEHVAAAHGATVVSKIPDTVGNPVTVNDPALTAKVLPSLQKVAGKDVVEMTLTTGAEDFAYYAKEVPGFFFFVGATPKGQDPNTAPSNHSPQFFLDESALPLGTRAMLQISLDYLAGTP
jgi:amidohydrolase